jgi:hypothetical protein
VDGRHVTDLHSQVQGEAVWATVSPDRSLLLTNGGLLYLLGGGPGLGAPTDLIPPGKQYELMPAVHPWADHGKAVVLVSQYGPSNKPVLLETNFRTDATTNLGDGVDAAGDPRSAGALVAVAASITTAAGQDNYPISRLELRRPGAPPATVLTARQFAGIMGFPPHDPYGLTGWYSPGGRYVAVTGDDLKSGTEKHGLLVLTRDGKPVAKATTNRQFFVAYWSPDGTKLAYYADPAENGAVTLTVLDIAGGAGRGRRTVTVPVGDNSPYLGDCLWSPTGDSALVCESGGSDSKGWQVVDLTSGKATSVTGGPAGSILVWLPVGGSQ